MTTLLDTSVSPVPGWVLSSCLSEAMTGWLLRAIVMENVAARAEGMALDLPAAPHFRLEKEIKNVVTVIAKTSHYWLEHMPRGATARHRQPVRQARQGVTARRAICHGRGTGR